VPGDARLGFEVTTMTQFEAAYRYAGVPDEAVMRALDSVREVYGMRRVTISERERIIRVEFDASRLKEPVVAGLLRGAGMDLTERLILA
jgi:hypothetical protein